MTKARYFDIGVIVPLEEELHVFLEHFPTKENLSTSDVYLHEVESGQPDIRIVLIHQSEMGHAEAGDAALELINRFEIGLLVCIGIAGAVSSDLKLGDVCYSGTIVDVLDNAKATDTGKSESGLELDFSTSHYETESQVTRALNYFRTQPALRPLYLEWQGTCHQIAIEACPEPVPGRQGLEVLARPKSLNGTIACGAVNKSRQYSEQLQAIDRKVLAIETESGAVFRQAKKHRIPALTVRGISDYGDAMKNRLEEASGGSVRDIAARNAISFFELQLKNDYFKNQLEQRRPGSQQSLDFRDGDIPQQVPVDPIEPLSEMIDEKLRELSPHFRSQPQGYQIPPPRVRRQRPYRTESEHEFDDPVEIRDAIKTNSKILLSVPRNYPDQSLPWILAHDLLNAEVNNKQVLPVIIDGSRLSPPSKGLSRLAEVDQNTVLDREGQHPVFIIENVPFASSSRLNFLRREISSFDEASFIFLSNSSPNILSESDFKFELSVDIFCVCDVSFAEMSTFLRRSFNLSDSQAEVVAKRLWDTFTEYELSAHPTYFAGIPVETLTALLEANCRAELIQLAVDGFLTIIVAEDDSRIALRRTTRARFLGNLAVEMHLEKRSLTSSEVVAKASEFAEQQDFEITPVQFIRDFENKGILHFENDRVQFSLPFIEQYLLAKRLMENENLAKQYFSIETMAFNTQVFDLYCELGPHRHTIESITDFVAQSTEGLSAFQSQEHILLTNAINPIALSGAPRVRSIQRKLASAVEDVQTGTSKARDKQHILDVTQRVKVSMSQRVGLSERHDSDFDKEEEMLDLALKAFHLGTMMIGSGAEHLNAEEKRTLSGKIVELGSLLIDVWTRRRSVIDFKGFKEDLLSEESLEAYKKGANGEVNEEEIRMTISGFIDLVESAVLSDPLRRTLGLLCEQARSPVLAKSLSHTEVSSPMAKLLHAAWLTDLNPDDGVVSLKQLNKGIPTVPFLRSNVALHCLSRAFWSHWKKADRLKLLDIADAFLSPLATKFDKAKLKREIEKD